ncbi:asparaginase [Roseovarius nanhaiticus]|uniref:Asparaginase n=1 Tax=Roseovarius nanhaiticus TaxID=573024 RepID=A0A1N7H7P4_9RHOB|nr:asparaginase [Roseovarius nanhaiticus]SEL10024.1 asparaginase [Roseovarius nanhaiticus]SIS20852.1 asparaginase [Roseovarius nanhaiticus]
MIRPKTAPAPLTEIWRGPIAESVHLGHAVICGPGGDVIEAWGDPDVTAYPRSSCKMIQALPLIESGAADAAGLGPEQLALACASHQGDPIHTGRVEAWVTGLGLGEDDLRCGSHMPYGEETAHALIRAGDKPCQLHNNCSGKHAGFLTLNRHLAGHADYVDLDHPVQRACLAAFEEVTGESSPGYGIDGCSAPNFLGSLRGMGRAMAYFATATEGADARQTAAARLRDAMIAHPDLVAGEGRACTLLMRACTEPVALKTGAEGFFIAILPQRGIGIALKIADGATRGAECAIATLLVRLGALDADHPSARMFMNKVLTNCRGLKVGAIRPVPGLLR